MDQTEVASVFSSIVEIFETSPSVFSILVGSPFDVVYFDTFDQELVIAVGRCLIKRELPEKLTKFDSKTMTIMIVILVLPMIPAKQSRKTINLKKRYRMGISMASSDLG
jgi:hypothetical protein